MTFPILANTDQGSGPPIVLLHGFPLSRRMWDREVRVWSKNFRVVAPDFRGFGDTPMTSGNFSMAGCAQDVRALLASLRIDKDVVLVGLSMGGYVCFEFLREYQDSLRGLILVATQPTADPDAGREARYETAEFVRRQGSSALAERLIPRFLGKTTLAKKPEVVKTVRTLIESNSPEAIAKACYGLAERRDATSFLADIRIPTLVVAGVEDALISTAQSEAMHRQLRHSQFVPVEECGHLINLEQPETLDNAVSAFVKQL
jgi:pimeloyl-ACP methyl ester carboxylesterase